MPKVHPSAFVGSEVVLADDVEIGPFCHLEGAVRIGSGCRLLHRVSIQGPVEIGSGNIFYPNCCIGLPPQDLGYDPATPGAGLRIGNQNIFREGVSIHRATRDVPTTVGNNNYLMINSHMAHDSTIADHCILVNGALLAGHVHLADQVIVAGNGVVHQFCHVGRLAMISGLSGIGQDLPPFCVSYTPRSTGSLNIVGLRRAGYRENLPNLKKAFDIIYREGLPAKAGADRVLETLGSDPLCVEMATFVKESKRGVVKYKPRTDSDD